MHWGGKDELAKSHKKLKTSKLLNMKRVGSLEENGNNQGQAYKGIQINKKRITNLITYTFKKNCEILTVA